MESSLCYILNTKHTGTPLKSFTTPGLVTCQEYCRNIPSCSAFTFTVTSPETICHIFQEGYENYTPHIGSVSANASCLVRAGCEKGRLVEESQKRGVYMQHHYSRKCLAANHKEEDSLGWKECKYADLWEITEMPDGFYKVQRHGSDDCLAWLEWSHATSLRLGQLQTCNSSLSQLFSISTAVASLPVVDDACTWTILDPDDFYISVKRQRMVNEHTALISVRFATTTADQKCKKFDVPHGTVLVEPSLPFHLPDSVIYIRCDPGYGMKGNSTYEPLQPPEQHVTCSPDFLPPVCSKAKKSKKSDNLDQFNLYKALLVVFVPLALSGLLVQAVVIFSYKKRLLKDKKNGENANGMSLRTIGEEMGRL